MNGAPDTPVIDYGTERRPNLAAVASLTFGLMLFVPLLSGVLAILFGRLGMRAARERAMGRYSMARAGFALGILNLAMTAAVATAYGVHEYRAARMRRCAANLKEIGYAILLYSNSHRGTFPPTFDELVTTGELPTGSPVFRCPDCAGGSSKKPATVGVVVTSDYVRAPPWDSMPEDSRMLGSYPITLVNAYEPLGNHVGRGIHLLLVDGGVKWVDAATAAKIVAELQRGQNPPPSLKW
jgi:hypothetical protein